MATTYKSWLSKAKLLCKEKGAEISAPLFLLEFYTKKDRIYFITHENECINDEDEARLNILVERFINFEPLAYITGRKEFYGREFFVDSSVLIPRPETELIIDAVKEYLLERKVLFEKNKANTVNICDIGTGSGILAISLAAELRECGFLVKIEAIDISHKALQKAKENAIYHNVSNCIDFYHLSLEEYESQNFAKKSHLFDIIVSNPPYIPHEEYVNLEKNVMEFEPKIALTSGESGYEIISEVLEFAGKNLVSEGLVLIEHGYNQNEEIQKMAKKQCLWQEQENIRDLSQIERVFKAIHK